MRLSEIKVGFDVDFRTCSILNRLIDKTCFWLFLDYDQIKNERYSWYCQNHQIVPNTNYYLIVLILSARLTSVSMCTRGSDTKLCNNSRTTSHRSLEIHEKISLHNCVSETLVHAVEMFVKLSLDLFFWIYPSCLRLYNALKFKLKYKASG